MSNILELKSISKNYIQGKSNIEILKNVNLSIKAGELVGILGSSGSGKSTMLHIAGLLDNQFSGEVIVKSRLTSKLNDNSKNLIRLNNIGFIYQYHHLLKDFSARENVAMPALIASKDYNESLKEADQLLSILGLGSRINNFPGELSGGEQQRVAIARSMINKPDIILADEPTGNLDNDSSNLVIDLFLKLAKERNLASIIVTHNNSIAEKLDSVYEIKGGILYKNN